MITKDKHGSNRHKQERLGNDLQRMGSPTIQETTNRRHKNDNQRSLGIHTRPDIPPNTKQSLSNLLPTKIRKKRNTESIRNHRQRRISRSILTQHEPRRILETHSQPSQSSPRTIHLKPTLCQTTLSASNIFSPLTFPALYHVLT